MNLTSCAPTLFPTVIFILPCRAEPRQRIGASDERQSLLKPPSPSPTRRTSTQAIGIAMPSPYGGGGGGLGVGGEMIPQSYTDQRMLDEEDFFENIIKRTENNLINTADFRDGLLTPDVAERAWKYGGALHPKDDRLPMPSTDAADLATVLGAPTNLGEDEWVLGLAKELNVLTSTMRVEDVGEVVTSLPELDFSIRGEL